MNSTTRRRAVRASLAVLLIGSMAACRSGSTANGTSPQNATSLGGDAHAAAVAVAMAEYQRYLMDQPSISIPALQSKPSTGLSIAVITCPLPVCKSETDPAVAAAKLLGWKVSYLQPDYSPQAYQATLNQLIQNPPNLAAITAFFPNSFVTGQLAALQKAGTKITEIVPHPGDDPSAAGPVLAVVSGPPQFTQSGRLMGDAIVSDANGAADTVFVWDPSLDAWGLVKNSLSSVVTGAGGSAAELQVSSMNVGKTIPTQVVSYVQSHPKLKYVAFAVADLAAGVPQALKMAGMSDQVKIISRAPQATTMADIADGDEWASVGEENPSAGYRAIDQLARLTEGAPLGALADPAGWAQIFVKSNVKETTAPPTTPGYPDAFLAAWNIK